MTTKKQRETKIDKAVLAKILRADRGAVREALDNRGGYIVEAPGYDREVSEVYALREVYQHADGNYGHTYGWARIIRDANDDIIGVKFSWAV